MKPILKYKMKINEFSFADSTFYYFYYSYSGQIYFANSLYKLHNLTHLVTS